MYEQASVQEFYVCLGEYVSLFVVICLSMFHCVFVFVFIVAFLLGCSVIFCPCVHTVREKV